MVDQAQKKDKDAKSSAKRTRAPKVKVAPRSRKISRRRK